MTLWWLVSVAAAGTLAVDVTWKGDNATLTVTPPEGHKIADDAPGELVLRSGITEVTVATVGSAFTSGVGVGDRRGEALEGELRVGLCKADGTECRPTSWTLSGTIPDAKKGTASLSVGAVDRLARQRTRFGPEADGTRGAAALARAADSGRPALLGFSAVWCEPCNRFAAEVLDHPPAELGAFETALVDSDNPASWALADRYGVTGYPTFIVAGPDGKERTRLVGYTTRDDFLAWLSTAPGKTDEADLARDPSTVDPKRAAELAWQLVYRLDEEKAGPWLARADQETVDFRLAHATLAHDPADVRWVLEHRPAELVWVMDVLPDIVERDPALVEAALQRILSDARGATLAEAMSVAAELESDPAQRRAWYRAAASVLTGELTGDPALDKGYVKDLASLEAKAGDEEAALARLADASRTWPNEPTFHLSAGRMHLKADRPTEALAEGDAALAVAWGDNRLRAGILRCKALVALGRSSDAAASARELLAEQPAPAEGQASRTTRHREELAAFTEPVLTQR